MSGANDELLQFLTSALGAPPSSDVLGALAAQEVGDKATLLECWDEVKDSLPGAPRKRIGDKVAKDSGVKIESMDFKPVFAPTVWVSGAVVAVILLAPALAVGYTKEHDADEEGEEDLSRHLWWRCWVPAIILGIGEIAASGYLAPKIGYDMIQEHSVGCDLREAMKNNMTNQGVVSALFLTVVWAMLQADVLWDDADRVLAQWYNALLVISIALTILGACISSMCLMYVEPLDQKAALQCVGDNFMYFGEPMACCSFGFINAVLATVLWVFGQYGLGAGTVSVIIFFYTITRCVVVYQYLSLWQNPDIDHAARAEVKKQIVTSTGKTTLKTSEVANRPQGAHDRVGSPGTDVA